MHYKHSGNQLTSTENIFLSNNSCLSVIYLAFAQLREKMEKINRNLYSHM